MLRPTVDQVDESDSDPEKDPAKVQMLQEKVRILIEGPLYFAGDMLDNELISEGARVLQIIHRQFGMYQLLKAAQVNQRRSLLPKL